MKHLLPLALLLVAACGGSSSGPTIIPDFELQDVNPNSPTTGQPAPLGLMKSICGSITTRAARCKSSVIPGSGNTGFVGSAYRALAAFAS